MRRFASDCYEVVIAGGGPVGLGLAIELGQRGRRVLGIERHREPQPIPKGQNLTQRTMEHFRAWHAKAALRAARTIPADYGIGGMTSYATLLGDYRYDWLQRDLVGRFYRCANERLPQYATERVLRARAAELACVDIVYGASVTGFAEDGEGMAIEIQDRGSGETMTARGAYLAGCDGSRSLVREAAGITQTSTDHDRLMALLVFRSKRLAELLRRYPGKSFYNILHPALEGYWLFFGRVDLEDQWFFHAPVPAEARDGGFDFKTYLETAVGEEIDVAFDHVGFWDLRFAVADQYRKGRVFIAGDAAHSHPPYGGYGINTGFEDARNLGWKLSAVIEGWGGAELLDSYHIERHGVFVSTARDFIAKAIDEDRAFLQAHDPERDRAEFEAAWSSRGAGAKDEVARFEPHYEGSPIVPGTTGAGGSALGDHRAAARAGHHLTPASLADGRNVFDVLGDDFTLLVFGPSGEGERLACAAAASGMPLTVVIEPSRELAAFYEAELVLVRPDHFVSWSGESAVEAEEIVRTACGLRERAAAGVLR